MSQNLPPEKTPEYDLLNINVLQNVKENKTSKREKKKQQIIDYVINDIKKNPVLSKNNVSVIERSCQLIENNVKKKDKIDKLELLLLIFNKLFNHLQPSEIEFIKSTVEYLLDKKLISKVKLCVKVYSYLKKVVINNCLFRDI